MEKMIKKLLHDVQTETLEDSAKRSELLEKFKKISLKIFYEIINEPTTRLKPKVLLWLSLLKLICKSNKEIGEKLIKDLFGRTLAYIFCKKIDSAPWFIKLILTQIYVLLNNKYLLLTKLFKCLWNFKTFEVQRIIIEIILSKFKYNEIQCLLKKYIDNEELQTLFRNIEIYHNYASIRKFLNQLNRSTDPLQIFSIKVTKVKLDDFELVEDVWVDVNISIRTISFSCNRNCFSEDTFSGVGEYADWDEMYDTVTFKLAHVASIYFKAGEPKRPDKFIFELSDPCTAYFQESHFFLSKCKKVSFYVLHEKDRFYEFVCQFFVETIKGTLTVIDKSSFILKADQSETLIPVSQVSLTQSESALCELFEFEGDFEEDVSLIMNDDNLIYDSEEETNGNAYVSKITRTPKPRRDILNISVATSHRSSPDNNNYQRIFQTPREQISIISLSATETNDIDQNDSEIHTENFKSSAVDKNINCMRELEKNQIEETAEVHQNLDGPNHINEVILSNSQNTSTPNRSKKRKKRRKSVKDYNEIEFPENSFFSHICDGSDGQIDFTETKTRTVRKPKLYCSTESDTERTKRKSPKNIKDNSVSEPKRLKVLLPVKRTKNATLGKLPNQPSGLLNDADVQISDQLKNTVYKNQTITSQSIDTLLSQNQNEVEISNTCDDHISVSSGENTTIVKINKKHIDKFDRLLHNIPMSQATQAPHDKLALFFSSNSSSPNTPVKIINVDSQKEHSHSLIKNKENLDLIDNQKEIKNTKSSVKKRTRRRSTNKKQKGIGNTKLPLDPINSEATGDCNQNISHKELLHYCKTCDQHKGNYVEEMESLMKNFYEMCLARNLSSEARKTICSHMADYFTNINNNHV